MHGKTPDCASPTTPTRTGKSPVPKRYQNDATQAATKEFDIEVPGRQTR
jgi:hypothetical protein